MEKRSVKRSIAAFIPALILLVIAAFPGIALYELHWPGTPWLTYGLFAVLVVLLLLNLVRRRRMHRDVRSEDVERMYAQIFAAKETAETAPQRYLKHMDRVVLLNWVYFAFVLLLVFCTLVGAIATTPGFSWLMLVCLYMLWGLFLVLMPVEKIPLPNHPLPQAECAPLYDLLRETAAELGIRKPVRAYLNGESISIYDAGREYCVLIGAYELHLLTRQELRQILLHEFAHVANRDTQRTARYNKLINRFDTEYLGTVSGIGTMLLQLPTHRLLQQNAIYQMVSSRYIEAQADKLALERGDRQAFANGLGKLAMLDKFRGEPCIALSYDCFAEETPPASLNKLYDEQFRLALEQREAVWRRLLSTEIPARLDSHPTFRMRLGASGVSDYQVDVQEPDAAYRAMQAHVLQMDDELALQAMQTEYEEARQTNYLDRKEQIDRYHAVPNPLEVYTNEELYKMCCALNGIEPDTALALAQYLVQQQPDNAYPVALLGRMLLQQEDPEGAELLFRAADLNDNFVDELDLVGDYALAHGDEALIERVREVGHQRSLDVLDRHNSLFTIGKHDRFSPNDLPEPVFREVLDFMLEHSQNALSAIYTVRKDLDDDHAFMYFLEYPADTPEETRDEVYLTIFRYLDMRKEQFMLTNLYETSPDLPIIRKAVPDCCIYRAETE